ncbi:glycosyltransferase [Adhaeribacter pallidiroseus]|uniref:Alpha-monoglucosyldiacylglycerol synthase n=1 Tax=Adhaeribacter pallidiroseus TaxID=2072847 RepID=A0A369QI59_9BACT|nr:glycosyltransferase [Adhaeribacter pallidiroseus]RDC62967.1 Alpha-monoglucosyldiacylglycerol synthase [Adhaeribacter pallidiroseus]
MNIFIIPSWYPCQSLPISGIFFQEQAAYLADYSMSNQIGVSLWGQSDKNLQWVAKDLLLLNKFLPKALYTIAQKKKVKKVKDNLFEYYNPVILWSKRIKNGNFQGIVEANDVNLKDFIRNQGKVDVIHAHVSFPAGFLAKQLSEKYKIPYIITEHMAPFPFVHLLNPDGSLQNEVFDSLNNAARIIAVSPSLSKRIKSFNLPEPVYIPNIIDEDFFKISSQNLSNSKFTFFCLGGMDPSKGIKELLYAVQKLLSNVDRPFCARIGGDGDYLEEYQSIAAELKITEHVKWLGLLSREEVRREHQTCDAFVLPSFIETFGVVYAEAIACGKPVIGAYSGGPECIINKNNGVLVKVGDIPDLATKMQFIMEYHNSYNAIEIRNDFENRFSKKSVIPRLLEVYESVIDK